MSAHAHERKTESIATTTPTPEVAPERSEEDRWGNSFATEVHLGSPAPPAAPPAPAAAESPEWAEAEPVEDVHLGAKSKTIAQVEPTLAERVAAARAAEDPAAVRAAVAGLYEEDLEAFELELDKEKWQGGGSSFDTEDDVILHAARRAELDLVPAGVVDDASVPGRAANAMTALQSDEPARLIESLRGMNGAEKKRFAENLHLLGNGGDKVSPDERFAAQEAFERELVKKLSPADYAEAMAQLDCTPVDAAKVSLKRALGELSFHRDANERYDKAKDKLSFSDKAEIGSRTFGRGAEMLHLPNLKLVSATYDLIAERTDVDETRSVELLEGMRPADRLQLLQDDEFKEELRPLLRSATKGEGTLEERWKLAADADPLEKADRAVEAEIRTEVEQRLGPDASPTAVARATRLEVRTAQADPKAWNERLEQATDADTRAELLAVRTEEALRGTGRWGLLSDAADGMDAVGINIDTNRAALGKVLDDVQKDPKVAAEWSRQVVDRVPSGRRKVYEEEGLTELQILKREIGGELEGRDLDWMDAIPLNWAVEAVTDGDADDHQALAVTTRLDGTAVQAELTAELAAMSKASGREITAAQIAAWNERLGSDKEGAVDLEIELVNAGLQPDDITYVAGLDAQRRELDRAARAHALVQASERGRFSGPDGALALMADPELEELDREIRDARAHASSSSPAQLQALEARQQTLREDYHERRQLLDEAVEKASAEAGGTLGGLDDLVDRTFRADSAIGLDEQKFMRRMAQKGELDLCDWMYVSTKGADTDVGTWKARMKGHTPEEITDAGRKFKLFYGREKLGLFEGTLAGVADADVVGRIVDSETSGPDEAALHRLALGDPNQVFDPRRTDLDPEQRAALARQALDVKMKGLALSGDAMSAGFGHDTANWMKDGEQNSMSAAVMTENQRKDVERWVTSNRDALETGDPEAWAEFERRSGRADAVLSAEDEVKTAQSAKAKAALLEGAAQFVMVPGLGPVTKAAIPLAAAGLGVGAEWLIRGDAIDMEKVTREFVLAGGKAALSAVKHKVLSTVLSVGLDTAVDTTAIRDGRALDVFASGLLKEIGSQGAEKLAGDALPKDIGKTERGATTRDATQAFASGMVDVIPKVLDGTASRQDVFALAHSVKKKTIGGKFERAEQFGSTPAEAEAVIAAHDRRSGPLEVTDEQVAGLLSKGIDPKSLTDRGVSALQVAKSSPWVRDLVAVEAERRHATDPATLEKLAQREQELRAKRPKHLRDVPPGDVSLLAASGEGPGITSARAPVVERILADGPSAAPRRAAVDEVAAGKRPLTDVPVEWLSPPAAWNALQHHDPAKSGKLVATDETLMQLQRLGADEKLLAQKGVSADQIGRVRASLALSDLLKTRTTALTEADLAAARGSTTDFGLQARERLRERVVDGDLPIRAVPDGWFTPEEREQILAQEQANRADPAEARPKR